MNLISVVLCLWSEDNNFKQVPTKAIPVTDLMQMIFKLFSLNNETNSIQSFLSQVSFITVCVKLVCWILFHFPVESLVKYGLLCWPSMILDRIFKLVDEHPIIIHGLRSIKFVTKLLAWIMFYTFKLFNKYWHKNILWISCVSESVALENIFQYVIAKNKAIVK